MRAVGVLCLAALALPIPLELQGRVTDAGGHPLAGAHVSSLPWVDTTTDGDGRFVFADAGDLVRFSLPGYQPKTTTTADLDHPVVLKVASTPDWAPPTCSSAQNLSPLPLMGGMRFVLPKRAKVRQSMDVDYVIVGIKYQGGWVDHASGPHWSGGLPLVADWRLLARVEERTILTPWGTEAAEYRGIRRDGTYWRFIGQFGETVEYSDVSATTAAHLDEIIATLCWVPRER